MDSLFEPQPKTDGYWTTLSVALIDFLTLASPFGTPTTAFDAKQRAI